MFDKFFARLKPAMFNYKKEEYIPELDTEKTFFGVMAQDIRQGLIDEDLDPDDFSIVTMQPTGYYAVDYDQLIPILISKIKTLETRVKTLEER